MRFARVVDFPKNELVRAKAFPRTADATETLFGAVDVPGKIVAVYIATAYSDHESIEGLLALVTRRGDARQSSIPVHIFIDRRDASRLNAGMTRNKDNDKRMTALKRSLHSSSHGNIDIQIYGKTAGTLFHSKVVLIETTTHRAAVVGSANFTNAGYTRNEEVACIARCEKGSKTQDAAFVTQVKSYFDALNDDGSCKHISALDSPSEAINATLRDVFLGGVLRYELAEQDALSFPLKIPAPLKKLLDGRASLDLPYVGTKVQSSFSLLTVPQFMSHGDEKKSDSERGRERWKRFTVQTCYGRWSPMAWDDRINDCLGTRRDWRKRRYAPLISQIKDHPSEVVAAIVKASEEIWIAIDRIEAGSKRTDLVSEIEPIAKQWVERRARKFADVDYCERLFTGIAGVDVPDIWAGSPSDVAEFESSFFDSLEYELSQPRLRNFMARQYRKKFPGSFEISADRLKDDFCAKSAELFDLNGTAIPDNVEEGESEGDED